MNITFRQLQLFLALAETGSVTGAAKRLHVTQPTASMQLKDISESVGQPLYEVVSRKVYLTEAGQELARTARAMLDEWDEFQQRMANLQGLTQGRLKVAVVSTAKYFVPRLMGDFCRQHPKVDVSLEVLNRDGVLQRLAANLDDLYIMSQPPLDWDLEDAVFMDNPLVVVAACNHPLAQRESLTLPDLQSERFILREAGSGTRMSVDRHFQQWDFHPQVRLELGSNEAIRESVAAGLGVSVLSQHALGLLSSLQGVTVLPVEGFPIQSAWHLVHWRKKRLSSLAQAFKRHINTLTP